MKKSNVIIVIFLLLSIGSENSIAQSKKFTTCSFSLKNGYSYQKSNSSKVRKANVGDPSGIPDVVEEIKSTIGIDVPIDIYIANGEENCYATIGKGGKRIFIADHLFLSKVNTASGTQWAAISIIAHEIGHHIAGFTRRSNSLQRELDADYWSGYILQKLGADIDASVKCIMKYGTEEDTDSHPNKYSRAETIKEGYNDAIKGNYDNDRCASCD